MRILGALMFFYGAVMLLLLFSPWKSWALDHSIAEVVSYSDRRVDNQVNGSVDDPLAYAGSAVLMFAGLWFWILVPRVIGNWQASVREQMYSDDAPGQAGSD